MNPSETSGSWSEARMLSKAVMMRGRADAQMRKSQKSKYKALNSKQKAIRQIAITAESCCFCLEFSI